MAVSGLVMQGQGRKFSIKRFVIVLTAGLVVPIVARALLGWKELTPYFPSWGVGLTVIALHVPCCAIVALFAGLSKTWGLPFGFSAVATFCFLAWAHFTLDLSSDAQAALVVLIIPVVAVPVALLSATMGGSVRFVMTERR